MVSYLSNKNLSTFNLDYSSNKSRQLKVVNTYRFTEQLTIVVLTTFESSIQCFDAVGLAAGRASGL